MGNAQVAQTSPSKDANPDTLPQYTKEEGPHWISDITQERPIKFNKAGIASEAVTPAYTIPQVIQKAVAKRGAKHALRIERGLAPLEGKHAPLALPLKDWKTWTWQQYYNESCQVAKALIHLGVEAHNPVGIFGFNSPEWFMAEIGAILSGGVAMGIYPTDTAEQLEYKLNHSSVKVVVCEDQSKYDKIKEASANLKDLVAVVCWAFKGEDFTNADGNAVKCLTWDSFLKLSSETTDDTLNERIKNQKPGQCCALIYTSGTTGNPKAVMISHDNILFDALACAGEMQGVCVTEEEERIMSYLPLSHVAGMMVDIVMPLVLTAFRQGWVTAYFARPYDIKIGTVGDRLRAVQPTLFLGVPRVWEKIAEKLKAIGAQTKGLKKSLAGWAKGLSLTHQQNCQLGGSGAAPFGYGLANSLVLSKIKAKLGLDKCKFGFTGAAPISPEILAYYGSLGIQINEVYGMSENTGGGTWSTNNCHVWGSCGYQVPGTEAKIFKVDPADINSKTPCPLTNNLTEATEEEQGEVCMRGRHIMLGYMANPALGQEHVDEINKKNAKTIDEEGWLHSEDKGAKDTNGMVKITGRYKELIIGAGGENIAPVPIEEHVKMLCPIISNFVMIGDKRKFNVALVTLKAVGATGELPGTDDLDGAAAAFKKGKVTKVSEAVKDADFIKAITDAIVATNKNGKVCPLNPSKVQKFSILPADLSMSTGELTPTFKTKRAVIEKMHNDFLDSMYLSKDTYVPFTSK